MKPFSIAHKLCQSRSKMFPNRQDPQKTAKDFEDFAKMENFRQIWSHWEWSPKRSKNDGDDDSKVTARMSNRLSLLDAFGRRRTTTNGLLTIRRTEAFHSGKWQWTSVYNTITNKDMFLCAQSILAHFPFMQWVPSSGKLKWPLVHSMNCGLPFGEIAQKDLTVCHLRALTA